MLTFKQGLRYGASECFERGLVIASKWANLQLLGITDDDAESDDDDDDGIVEDLGRQEYCSRNEKDKISLALALINTGEYLRCAHFLRKQAAVQGRGEASRANKAGAFVSLSSLKVKSKRGIFLAMYSLYMAGEKLKDQQLLEVRGLEQKNAEKLAAEGRLGGAGGAKSVEQVKQHPGNPFLCDIFNDLYPLYIAAAMDGFLLYIFAIVVRDLKTHGGGPLALRLLLSDAGNGEERVPSPLHLFVASLRAFPWNWSCWLDLAAYCQHANEPPPSWSDLHAGSEEADLGSLEHADEMRPDVLAVWAMHKHFLTHFYISCHDGTAASESVTALASCSLYNPRSTMGGGNASSSNLGSAGGRSPGGGSNSSMYSDEGGGGGVGLGLDSHYQTYAAEGSPALVVYQGLVYYSNRDYARAEECFEQARLNDPHNLEHVDTYSNILYTKEKKAELSHLARAVTKIDKFSAQACVVVGNYYSLRGHHERAISSFQRALRVNKNFQSLWTLMGHEYVELRNTQSAVQCYRRAVEVSPTDFKAWYGLGQIYELLHLYQYALHYYKKATAIKPMDARMWSATGSCMVKLGCRREAMLVFERAVACGDREGVATRELARLYRDEGRLDEAADCYLRKLAAAGHDVEEILDAEAGAAGSSSSSKGTPGTISSADQLVDASNASAMMMQGASGRPLDHEHVEGVLFLANFYHNRGDFRVAEVFCNFLVDFVGPEADDARAIMRNMRSKMLFKESAQSSSAANGTMRTTRSRGLRSTPE